MEFVLVVVVVRALIYWSLDPSHCTWALVQLAEK